MSPKYNRGNDASSSPRMRDIERELEKLQQQYRTKDKPPKEVIFVLSFHEI